MLRSHMAILMSISATLVFGCENGVGWTPHGSHIYCISTSTATFWVARTQCRSFGAELADITTVFVADFIKGLMNYSNQCQGVHPQCGMWVGLTKTNPPRPAWVWQDDTKAIVKWETPRGNWQYAVMCCTGNFKSMNGITALKYICEGHAPSTQVTRGPFASTIREDSWSSLGPYESITHISTPYHGHSLSPDNKNSGSPTQEMISPTPLFTTARNDSRSFLTTGKFSVSTKQEEALSSTPIFISDGDLEQSAPLNNKIVVGTSLAIVGLVALIIAVAVISLIVRRRRMLKSDEEYNPVYNNKHKHAPNQGKQGLSGNNPVYFEETIAGTVVPSAPAYETIHDEEAVHTYSELDFNTNGTSDLGDTRAALYAVPNKEKNKQLNGHAFPNDTPPAYLTVLPEEHPDTYAKVDKANKKRTNESADAKGPLYAVPHKERGEPQSDNPITIDNDEETTVVENSVYDHGNTSNNTDSAANTSTIAGTLTNTAQTNDSAETDQDEETTVVENSVYDHGNTGNQTNTAATISTLSGTLSSIAKTNGDPETEQDEETTMVENKIYD